MRVYNYGTKVLRKVAKRINYDNYPYRDYYKTMKHNISKKHIDYITLPQMGESRRMFMVQLSNGIKTFLNPKIKYGKNKVKTKETCNSLPNIESEVLRSNEIVITYDTIDLERRTEVYKGEDAFRIQHCFDHLDGIFQIDFLNKDEIKEISSDLNEISKGKEQPIRIGDDGGRSLGKKRKLYGARGFGSSSSHHLFTGNFHSNDETGITNEAPDEEVSESPSIRDVEAGEIDLNTDSVSLDSLNRLAQEIGRRERRQSRRPSEGPGSRFGTMGEMDVRVDGSGNIEIVDSGTTEDIPTPKKSISSKKKKGLPHFTSVRKNGISFISTSTESESDISPDTPENQSDMGSENYNDVKNRIINFLKKKTSS